MLRPESSWTRLGPPPPPSSVVAEEEMGFWRECQLHRTRFSSRLYSLSMFPTSLLTWYSSSILLSLSLSARQHTESIVPPRGAVAQHENHYPFLNREEDFWLPIQFDGMHKLSPTGWAAAPALNGMTNGKQQSNGRIPYGPSVLAQSTLFRLGGAGAAVLGSYCRFLFVSLWGEEEEELTSPN